MCLAWGRTVTVALLVGFSRCFYLLAPFPATLCPVEARRHQRLQFCYSLLGMERSGTAVQRCWPRRSSGIPLPRVSHCPRPTLFIIIIIIIIIN
uniref:Uncharacterized protein n=1 Tax=Gorilla gorilla gorilla TaxID=9595 RepID=A0A2I2ZNY4_GORGO